MLHSYSNVSIGYWEWDAHMQHDYKLVVNSYVVGQYWVLICIVCDNTGILVSGNAAMDEK